MSFNVFQREISPVSARPRKHLLLLLFKHHFLPCSQKAISPSRYLMMDIYLEAITTHVFIYTLQRCLYVHIYLVFTRMGFTVLIVMSENILRMQYVSFVFPQFWC